LRPTDSDGDGILDALETGVDSVGDRTPNYIDNDSDDDKIHADTTPDATECKVMLQMRA